MATDVPVQLDGVSEAERPAPEGATAPHNAHQQGKHSKRSRDGKEKDRHKHSKHRKRSKPEHRSSERRERHDDGGRSPAGAPLRSWCLRCGSSHVGMGRRGYAWTVEVLAR